MSDSEATDPANENSNAPRNEAQVRIERLYLKDASFESPGSPAVFTEQFQPQNQVDINTSVNSLGDGRHEVVLAVTVTARRDEERVAFIAEAQHAGLFTITGVSEAQLRQVLGVFCPSTLFPYVREGLDSLVVKGGFPPLQLAPINFEVLYAQAMQQQAAAGQDVKH